MVTSCPEVVAVQIGLCRVVGGIGRMPMVNMEESRYGGSVYGTLGHPVDARVCKIDSVG